MLYGVATASFLAGVLAVLLARKLVIELAGDRFCGRWPFCWRRATHVVSASGCTELPAVCEHHAAQEALELVIDGEDDVKFCTVNARLNDGGGLPDWNK